MDRKLTKKLTRSIRRQSKSDASDDEEVRKEGGTTAKSTRRGSSVPPQSSHPSSSSEDQDTDTMVGSTLSLNLNQENLTLGSNKSFPGKEPKKTGSVTSTPAHNVGSRTVTNPTNSDFQSPVDPVRNNLPVLDIEIPDGVTDIGAFRRYLSTRRGAVGPAMYGQLPSFESHDSDLDPLTGLPKLNI